MLGPWTTLRIEDQGGVYITETMCTLLGIRSQQ